MKTNAIVLGCGVVGAAMARDLAADGDFAVTVADVSADNLRMLASICNIKTVQADLSDAARVGQTVADFDLVLGALPSAIGFQTLRAVIEAGKPYCDVSFMPEDALELDDLAKTNGVTVVVDCGVSPGLSNMIVGYVDARLDRTERGRIYVGGLPKERYWPYQFRAPFAPLDIIEEYTRPTRMVENGRLVTKPALSEPELMDFPHIGTLEAFNTDGLRSLLSTVDIPDLKEKTLRYPGHIELMRVLRETGFFGKREIEVNGVPVRPLDLTAKLLFPEWAFRPGEEEFTVLRVVVEGIKDGHRVRHTHELYDEYDRSSGVSSMARTTAFPCVIIARMLAAKEFNEPGVIPPELLVRQEGVFDRLSNQLDVRGVCLTGQVEKL